MLLSLVVLIVARLLETLLSPETPNLSTLSSPLLPPNNLGAEVGGI